MAEETQNKEDKTVEMPENFGSVMNDFTRDLTLTFPEYAHLWARWMDPNNPREDFEQLYGYCLAIYPERFFDILYQNEDIFSTGKSTTQGEKGEEEKKNTFFLPGVDFNILFNAQGISSNIKKAMWKYLQLVLITIMSGIKDKASFGDTMNLFDGIDETELQSKLSETINGLADFFTKFEEREGEREGEGEGGGEGGEGGGGEGRGGEGGGGEGRGEGKKDSLPFDMDELKKMFEEMQKDMPTEQSDDNNENKPKMPDFSQFESMFKMFSSMGNMGNMGLGGKKMPDMKKIFKMFENMPEGTGLPDFKNMFNFENIPNAEDLSGHLKGLFDGKIGTLAKELAEELSGDLMGMFSDPSSGEDMKSTQQILGEMMKNPQKIMELLKKVGGKLDDKMKNGDISQEEIMKEASELMDKMKGMGGGKQFQDMMQNMMKGMGGLGKGAKIDTGAVTRMTTQQAHKTRMLAKLEQRKQAAQAALLQQQEQRNIKELENASFILEEGKRPNNLVFKMRDEGIQEKSSASNAPVNDDWLNDYPPETIHKKSSKSSNSSNKKKGKK